MSKSKPPKDPYDMFKNPFSFEGRIRRGEYFISFVFSIFLLPCIYIIGNVGYLLIFPALFFWCWFLIAQTAKRCHDMGHSGFFQYIPLYHLYLLFADGEPFENEFGPTPKKISAY